MQRAAGHLRRLGREVAAAVARALEELDARHERIAQQRVDGEQQRPLHEAVDQQPVLRGIDVGHAVVMALEVQAVRRDDALEALERRARGAGAGRARRGADRALHVRLVFRAAAVGAHAGAGSLRPGRDLRRPAAAGPARISVRPPPRSAAPPREKQTPVQQAVAGHLLQRIACFPRLHDEGEDTMNPPRTHPMLELRPTCEHCNTSLPANSEQAMICSFECTFCASCVENVLGNVCPNCGGGFSPRPVRPARNWNGDNYVGKYPPGTTVRHRPVDAAAHRRFAETIRRIPPAQR